MLNTSDVKSLSKGGTTVSLEGISNSIDNKLSIDNLTGGNGIVINKNAAGDKVEVKIAIPETGPITLTNNNVPRPAISIEVADGGPPAFGGITISNATGSDKLVRLGPRQVLAKSGVYELTFDANGITSRYHDNEVGHGLISGGPNGNVKTVNGQDIYGSGNIDTTPTLKTVNSQSIIGSGNIDTTPTLKTINSQSITGDGNIYLKEFGVTSSNELNFKASASMPDLYVGFATISDTGAKQTGYTISSYKFMKGTGSTSAFADLYCAKLYTSSDERLKENIKPYEPTTSVLDLSIKEFNYKDSKVKSVGVIAQEVQKLFPDAVSVDKKSGYLSVDDRSLMYMLMAEVKKLRDRVNELEGK